MEDSVTPSTEIATSNSYSLDDLREIGTLELAPDDYSPKLASTWDYESVYLYWVDSHDKATEVYVSDENTSASKLNMFDKELETGEYSSGISWIRCVVKGSTCTELDGTIMYHTSAAN